MRYINPCFTYLLTFSENIGRCSLSSAIRGDLVVPATRTVRYTVLAALLLVITNPVLPPLAVLIHIFFLSLCDDAIYRSMFCITCACLDSS